MFDPKEAPKKETRKEKSERMERVSTPSRRDFLKGMAIGASGLAMSSVLARKAEAVDIDVFAIKQSLRNEDVSQGRISHDYRLCVGCQTCEMACAQYNHGEAGPFKSRIKIYTHQPTIFVGIVCQQCGDRPCINACPVEPDEQGRRALYEHPDTKALAVNYDTCINCGRCVDACATQRNGNMRMNASDFPDGYCTLCDGDPQCVKMCPQNALAVVPRVLDGRFAAKNQEVLAAEYIEQAYGGSKYIIDNVK